MTSISADTASTVKPAPTPRVWRLLFGVLQEIKIGRLTVLMPDGSERVFSGPQPGPSATVRVIRHRLARRMLWGGGVGVAEAYIDGDWDSPNLPTLLELAARNEQAFDDERLQGHAAAKLLRRMVHFCRRNTRRGSRRNIAAHYDLGNRFFEKWLDRSMTYSSAVFDEGEVDLERAQRRKYALLADQLGLAPGMRVLEIGCGWGGFAEYAARERGCSVTAITVSEEQRRFTEDRMARAGVADRVEVRLQDYRDLNDRFDRIVSIEMLEAVGERFWPTYFDKLRTSLEPGGMAGLQVITIADRFFDNYRRGNDFIQRYIFPGGMLPSPSALARTVAGAGLDLRAAQRFGADYALTLADWRRRFGTAWPEISEMGFDDGFRRMWDYYLSYCEAGFRAECTDVLQIVLGRD